MNFVALTSIYECMCIDIQTRTGARPQLVCRNAAHSKFRCNFQALCASGMTDRLGDDIFRMHTPHARFRETSPLNAEAQSEVSLRWVVQTSDLRGCEV